MNVMVGMRWYVLMLNFFMKVRMAVMRLHKEQDSPFRLLSRRFPQSPVPRIRNCGGSADERSG